MATKASARIGNERLALMAASVVFGGSRWLARGWGFETAPAIGMKNQ
jgi:hypothetical protein